MTNTMLLYIGALWETRWPVTDSMKVLGVTLDCRLTLDDHYYYYYDYYVHMH